MAALRFKIALAMPAAAAGPGWTHDEYFEYLTLNDTTGWSGLSKLTYIDMADLPAQPSDLSKRNVAISSSAGSSTTAKANRASPRTVSAVVSASRGLSRLPLVSSRVRKPAVFIRLRISIKVRAALAPNCTIRV
ncbi:hypothetical protein B0A48_05126 [Cryoendolithus antarcticus]|uniref:Uncharacterized protein n=1 Tax=Cryoendolithus antarcticus TaxID=1507870 RepID=A0A1V8TEC3_9PEZI|nr:hypothetical protein B0A48_05126 [Cryoendolithus antarcticus]